MSKVLPTVILCVLGVWLVLTALGRGGGPELEVRRWGAITADDGFAFDVTNVDHDTIKITAMTVNDRQDCTTGPIGMMGPGKLPIELKVGDKVTVIATCLVIRVNLLTDRGSAEFSF